MQDKVVKTVSGSASFLTPPSTGHVVRSLDIPPDLGGSTPRLARINPTVNPVCQKLFRAPEACVRFSTPVTPSPLRDLSHGQP